MADHESIILGTDMPSPLQLNAAAGPLTLDAITWGLPKKKPQWIEGRHGAVLLDDEMAYENAEAVAVVRAIAGTFDLARAEHGKLVEMLQEAERRGEDGLPCSYTGADGATTWTWYLLLGEADDLPVDHDSGYFAKSPVLNIRMTRKPALYAPEVTGPTVTSSLPVITLTVPDVPGDLPAEGRVEITDMATQARRFAEIGLECRYLAEETAANGGTAPSLLIDSDDLVTSGYSGSGSTQSGAYDPNASGNSTVSVALRPSPTVIASTGNQKHIGTFRVRARVYSTTTDFALRLAYQAGDGPMRPNPYASPQVSSVFTDIDLGIITIDPAVAGTQRWTGRLEGYSVGGATVHVDYLRLIPCGEWYAKARAGEPTGSAIDQALDGFTSTTAGNTLNGRTPLLGAAWVTSGAATDFTFADFNTEEQVTRATSNDGGSTIASGRFGVLGSSLADTQVKARTYIDATHNAASAGAVETGVVARFTDANNFIAAYIGTSYTIGVPSTRLKLFAVAGGTPIANLQSAPLAGAVDRWQDWAYVKLVVYASGIATASVLDSTGSPIGASLTFAHTALATSGTIASGKAGLIDRNATGTVLARYHDDVSVQTPPQEQIVIYSGRELELASNGARRADSTGTYYGQPPIVRGDDFRLPPEGAAGRSSRIAASVRRYDSDIAEDAGLTDSTKLQVFYRPRYLVPR